ncbi:hypothetical protein JCM10212_003348 [Sporobolomyces blumeae]
MDNQVQNSGSNQPFHATSGSVPDQDKANQAEVRPDGSHFNQITQKWESPSSRPEVASSQGASTMPDADGGSSKPGFMDQVNGFAKKFAGKATGKEHEVAQGDALLQGRSKEEANVVKEEVKQN